MTKLLAWPEPSQIPIVRSRYRTPIGDLPRVTSILKALGLGTQFLMRWAAETERNAVLLAATEVYAEGKHGDGPAAFAAAIEQHLGDARAHTKELAEAADIGTLAHERVRWGMAKELGLEVGPEPVLLDRSLWAWMAFDDFWKASGLKIVRAEQPVWHPLGYAGTIDIVAEDPEQGLGVLDIKTSKYIYDEHHIQVAAYIRAGRAFADLKWGKIVKLPKKLGDPAFEVRELGDMNPAGMTPRRLTIEQLLASFDAALTVYHNHISKEKEVA